MEERTLDNQSLTSEQSVRKIVGFGLGLLLVIILAVIGIYQLRMNEPYVHDVLALNGNVQRGNAIFQLNCAGCHGKYGNGKVGPSLRGITARRSQISLMHQVTDGKTPPMPKFQASPDEMADLLSYLKTL